MFHCDSFNSKYYSGGILKPVLFLYFTPSSHDELVGQLSFVISLSDSCTLDNVLEATQINKKKNVLLLNNTLKVQPPTLLFLSQMKTIMAKSFQDLSSKKQFKWTTKVSNEEQEVAAEDPSLKASSNTNNTEDGKTANIKLSPSKPPEVSISKSSSLNSIHEDKKLIQESVTAASVSAPTRRNAVERLKSVLTSLGRNRGNVQQGLGTKVVGTLFGHKHGHVHFAFQKDPNSQPAFLVELATPISGLVHEMASGLVRIALECDKEEEKKSTRLIDEPLWRTYCNGKKCGFATTRECGPKELQILKAVEPISMGAGVLPGTSEESAERDSGDVMYMRAKFERVVGSRDSEAFYMMNPDSDGAAELSIYLLRV